MVEQAFNVTLRGITIEPDELPTIMMRSYNSKNKERLIEPLEDRLLSEPKEPFIKKAWETISTGVSSLYWDLVSIDPLEPYKMQKHMTTAKRKGIIRKRKKALLSIGLSATIISSYFLIKNYGLPDLSFLNRPKTEVVYAAPQETETIEQYVEPTAIPTLIPTAIPEPIVIEPNYRINNWQVDENKDGRFDSLIGWIKENTGIDLDHQSYNCNPEAVICGEEVKRIGFELWDSDNTLHVRYCLENPDGTCGLDTETDPLILRISEHAIDNIIESTGGREKNNTFFAGADVKHGLAEGYQVRDVASFLNAINPGYTVDELEQEIMNCNLFLLNPNLYWQSETSRPLAVIDNGGEGAEFWMEPEQFIALQAYFP